jgi:hypothetical protein
MTRQRLGKNLDTFCNLMPKKPENKFRGIPHFPILECRVKVVSQAIFEQSLGSFFAFYLFRSQLTFFLTTSRRTVGELSN